MQGGRKDFWSGLAVIGARAKPARNLYNEIAEKVIWPKPHQPDRLLRLCNVFSAWAVGLVGHCTYSLPLFPPPYFSWLYLYSKFTSISWPMNAYIFICQLLFSVAKFQCNINESTSEFNQLILGTIYGIWNLDFFHSFLPPLSPFCLTLRICCSLVYTPCCWLSLACVYIQLNPRGCRVIVQDVSAAVDEGGEGSGTH